MFHSAVLQLEFPSFPLLFLGQQDLKCHELQGLKCHSRASHPKFSIFVR